MSGFSTYARYDVKPGEKGTARVRLSREGWCGKDKPGNVTVRVGTLAVNDNGQPKIDRLVNEQTSRIHSCQVREFVLPTPDQPWLVEVSIDPTFSPKELDPKKSDPRQLGAVVTYSYVPSQPTR